MTASPDDPTAKDVAASPEPPATTSPRRPLPRRERGPSAIAEAGASSPAPRPGAAPDGAAPEPGPEYASIPPMSAAAAEFAALTTEAPDPADMANSAGSAGPRPGPGRPDDPVVTTATPPRRSRRPRPAVLAGAGLVAALLIGTPFLLNGGDGGTDHTDASGSAAGSLLGDGKNGHAPDSSGGATPQASVKGVPQERTPSPVPSPTPSRKSGGTKKSGGKKGTTATPTASAAPDTPSVTVANVRLRGAGSGRCIDVTDGSTADQTPLQIWDCGGVDWQKWTFFADGTVRSLGTCMTVAGGSRDDGAAIRLAGCDGSGAQRFRLTAANDLVNVQADKCVDVTDVRSDNGARLQLWGCSGGGNQKWSIY
ncbi:ricin-type beta-trefoil lectin domain protein [Streptomyces sp. NPDC007901]|uniref:ricin-type beta-trefoil lectin domain protein n=1 Tax=Streptomyces sp. NPDC007901 TaxID=3364785 RepID=UPI0036E3BB2D